MQMDSLYLQKQVSGRQKGIRYSKQGFTECSKGGYTLVIGK
jgi:hypothetical protein